MNKALCGPCALKGELNLETRIHLANSRKLDVVYICPDCGSSHRWTFKREGAEVPEQPAPEMAENVEKEEKETFIQTMLF
ncbi:hypothetical protein [Marinimicrococcus flavescens]|uniref:Uncharacterized protein n=1 Tax=Marinimicrococcus flavescens TaxID=3031815 RepID=A0AAP3XRX2_9PROT|nr:hypothetical protein [Marinimicrococcus flavescens]